jgi:hypothetical protein
VPFEAGVALSVVVRWVPIKTRCEWHASGTAGEDDPGSGVADRHRLNHRVRLVLGDHCLAGRSLEGAGPVPHRLVVGADFVTISGRSRCIHRPSRGVLPTARRRRGSIKRTRWAWVAWSMLAVFIVSMVFGIILAVANGTFQQDAANQVMLFVGFSAFMVVGARIVAHRPSNAIGWIFSAIALLAFTGQLASEYATHAYVTRPGSLPGAILAAWYASWVWFLVVALALVFTPLLFPTGRLLSPGWRPAAWLAGVMTVALTVLGALQADLDVSADQVTANPDRAGLDARPGGEHGRRRAIHPVGSPDRGGLRVAGGPVSAVTGRGAPAAEVVYLRGRAVAAGIAGRLPACTGWRLGLRRRHRVPAGGGRHRHPPLSVVRHRPADQPYPGLRAAHRPG